MNYEDKVTKEYVENAIANAGAKIIAGSYIGTGTYGSNNPSSITFPFAPKLIMVGVNPSASVNYFTMYWPHMGPLSLSYSPSTFLLRNVSMDGCTMRWYSTDSADRQLNLNGVTYYYVAIG